MNESSNKWLISSILIMFVYYEQIKKVTLTTYLREDPVSQN